MLQLQKNEAETHENFFKRSCTLTVDQQPEEWEMHRLEVELESELQKLPWGTTEGSGSEGRTNIFEVRFGMSYHSKSVFNHIIPSVM